MLSTIAKSLSVTLADSLTATHELKPVRYLFICGILLLGSISGCATSDATREPSLAGKADIPLATIAQQPASPSLPVADTQGMSPDTSELLETEALHSQSDDFKTGNQPSTYESTDFWRIMLEGFAVPPLAMHSVVALDRLYANNPDFLVRSLQRASPYIHEIIIALKQRGMPTDLALLPVIESGFDPGALSPASAAGIWQFIPGTGRRFGLKQNWLRDERRDPLAATNAALDYLQVLHKQFGDWHLALAAYNCGENCVARAVQKSRALNGGRDFASIERFLPGETRDYVPRFIAVRNVFRSINTKGISLPHIHDHSRITSIFINQVVDLPSIARMAGMRHEELSTLNAGVLRQAVPSTSSLIWLPESALGKLKLSIAERGEKKEAVILMNLKPARANPGESLKTFAARHLVSVDQLRAINNIPASLHNIQSGTLFIPRPAKETMFQGDISSLAPLKMSGEERLFKALANKNNKLLATHPQLAKSSGWIPGRLRLVGGRAKARRK